MVEFEWDPLKNKLNQMKHDIGFIEAQHAFDDPRRVILIDSRHSQAEQRFFCISRIPRGIVTVRFTKRNGTIRIIGAGFWKKWRMVYEEKNNAT